MTSRRIRYLVVEWNGARWRWSFGHWWFLARAGGASPGEPPPVPVPCPSCVGRPGWECSACDGAGVPPDLCTECLGHGVDEAQRPCRCAGGRLRAEHSPTRARWRRYLCDACGFPLDVVSPTILGYAPCPAAGCRGQLRLVEAAP